MSNLQAILELINKKKEQQPIDSSQFDTQMEPLQEKRDFLGGLGTVAQGVDNLLGADRRAVAATMGARGLERPDYSNITDDVDKEIAGVEQSKADFIKSKLNERKSQDTDRQTQIKNMLGIGRLESQNKHSKAMQDMTSKRLGLDKGKDKFTQDLASKKLQANKEKIKSQLSSQALRSEEVKRSKEAELQYKVKKSAMDQAYKISKDYESHKTIKNTFSRLDNYENMKTIVANPNKGTGASDMSLVFSYMKMLDPGSTVREGEFASAANSGGVGSKILNIYNKTKEGILLTPQMRTNFLDEAKKLAQSSVTQANKIRGVYKSKGDRYKLNTDLIVGREFSLNPDEINNRKPIKKEITSKIINVDDLPDLN